MKKVLLVTGLFIGLVSFGQTIDTSFHYCAASKIQPLTLQVNYPNIDTVTHLGVMKIERDYTTKQTNVTYYFGNNTRNVKGGNYIIQDVIVREVEEVLSILGVFLNITFK
jgi:hypothetical protein